MRGLFLTTLLLFCAHAACGADAQAVADELHKLEQQRERLLTRFTEQHPDIKIIDRKRAELRERMRRQAIVPREPMRVSAPAEGRARAKTSSDDCRHETLADGGGRALTNGRLKLVLGQASGGFIDAAYLDRNADGVYADDERIAWRADGESAIAVSYVAPSGDVAQGMTVGETVEPRVSVRDVRLAGCTAHIIGELDYGSRGAREFSVAVRTTPGSTFLAADLEFEPLGPTTGLVLKDVSLRVFGDFDRRDPAWRRHSASQGIFRTTPRPDKSYQFLVWQHGGHLVESPWYWRNWSAWSRSSGPVTTREGHVPGRYLEYYMQDNTHGIRVGLEGPAAVAPVELSGHGAPSAIAVHAWSPRVPGRGLDALPPRVFLKNIGMVFYQTELEGLKKDRHRYFSASKAAQERSSLALRQGLSPALSNLIDARMPATLIADRLAQIGMAKATGWDAEVARATALRRSEPSVFAEASGPGWLAVQLDVPAVEGWSGGRLPARGGVPFPRGVLRRTEQVRLLDEQGVELPLQVDRLAVWPDGSVKWLLLTALVDPGDGKQRSYRVEYGEGVARRARFPTELVVEQDDGDGITVDTGVVRFSLRRSGDGLFDRLWFDRDRDGRYAADELVVASDRTSRRNRLDLATFETPDDYAGLSFHAEKMGIEASRALVEDIQVERAGPASVHLLVSGRYLYDRLGRGREEGYQNRGIAFRLRYVAYAGQPYIEARHWFVFEGNPEREMVRHLGLSLTPRLTGKVRWRTDGDDGALSVSEDDPFAAGVYQDNPHSVEVWRSDGPRGPSRVVGVGRIAGGWVAVADQRQGLTIGLRDMRESYAKELALRDGQVEINLWPRRARPLDTRRYSRQYVDGESTSFGRGVAQGVARSHQLFFLFHDAAATDVARQTVGHLQRPIFIKAAPQWYAGTRAAGYFGAADSARHPKWEALLSNGLGYFLLHRELWAWYGFYDQGDFQQRSTRTGGWGKRNGRWGWVNNEALADMWIYEQFMRTGRRDLLDTALAMTRHVMNVDLINAVPYKGNRKVLMHGHRHNVNHWGDGFVGIRIAAPHGFRLGYYLTGDLEIREQLGRILDAHQKSMYSYDRSAETGLGILLTFWELTGDDSYRRRLAAYLDFQVAHFKKFGHIANPVWDFTRESWSGDLDKASGKAPTSFFFQGFGSAYALMELADLTGRQDLIDALVSFARQTLRERADKWEAAYAHYRLMAFAYRHSGDRVFIDYALKKSARLKVPNDRQRWPTSSAMDAFDNKLSMLVWTGHGLPYLIESMRLVDEAGEARPADPVEPPTAARKTAGDSALASNSWRLQQPIISGGTIAHLVYLPNVDGMLYWGYPSNKGTRYDVELFDLSSGQWVEQIPPARDRKAAKPRHQRRGTFVTVFDGDGRSARPALPAVNRPYWVAGQSCFIPTLGKVLYFAGGATFLYDPVERSWEDLAIPLDESPPDVMLGSMAWDPVRQRVILFGGGYISAYKGGHATPWNRQTWDDQAKRDTWAFDPETRVWRKLVTGSAGLRAGFDAVTELFRRANEQLAAIRAHALQIATVVGQTDRAAVGDRIRRLGSDAAALGRRHASAGDRPDAYDSARAAAAAQRLEQVSLDLMAIADMVAGDAWAALHRMERARWILHEAAEEFAPAPMPRYYGHMVTDTRNGVIVLFGGHGGDRLFSDTWIFEPTANRWRKSQSRAHPPMNTRPAMAFYEPEGKVFLATSKHGWLYDVVTDDWQVLETHGPPIETSAWLTIAYAPKQQQFVAVTTGSNLFDADRRQTALLTLDTMAARTADPQRYGGPTWAWIDPKYENSLSSLPKTDRDYQQRISRQAGLFAELPANVWKRLPDPAYRAQDRSYGSFTLDWDRGQLVLWGGGHSAYMGNEVSQYDIKSNTWLESWAPDLPPWPFGRPDGDGWNPPLTHRHGSAHGYHRYSYNADTQSVAFFGGRSFYDPDRMRWSPRSLARRGDGAVGEMVEMSGANGLLTVSPRYYRGGPFGVWRADFAHDALARIAGSDTPVRSNDRAKPVYDPKRDRILWFGVRHGDNKKNNALWQFDLKDQRWRDLSPELRPPDVVLPENKQWGNAFSTRHDVMMLLPGNQGTWLYDAQDNVISRVAPHPDTGRRSTKGVVYDNEHDLFIALENGNYGVGPVAVWVFRYVPEGR